MKLQTDSQSLVHGKQGFSCTLSVCEDFSNERQIIRETGDVISSVLHFSTESKEYLLWGYTFKNVAKTRFLFLRVLWRCKLITFCLINTLRNENPTVVVMWSQSSVFRSIFKLNIHLWIFFYSLIIFICGWLCKCKTLLTMSLSANAIDSWAASLQSCFTSGIFKMFASSSFFFWEREIAKLFFPPTKHLLQAGGKVPHTFAHCPSAVCSFVCLLPAAPETCTSAEQNNQRLDFI